jgi:response regulator of citrate/malate metabolism
MKILAFEDTVDIESLLRNGKVDCDSLEILQHWNTADHLEIIEKYAPDVLLLDHYIPPTRGLQVLNNLLASDIARPARIIAMSSANMANHAMIEAGADEGIIKSKLAKLEFWPRHS